MISDTCSTHIHTHIYANISSKGNDSFNSFSLLLCCSLSFIHIVFNLQRVCTIVMKQCAHLAGILPSWSVIWNFPQCIHISTQNWMHIPNCDVPNKFISCWYLSRGSDTEKESEKSCMAIICWTRWRRHGMVDAWLQLQFENFRIHIHECYTHIKLLNDLMSRFSPDSYAVMLIVPNISIQTHIEKIPPIFIFFIWIILKRNFPSLFTIFCINVEWSAIQFRNVYLL